MLIHTTTVCSLLGIGYMHQKHECKNINIFLFKKEKNNVTEFTFKRSGNVRVIVAFGLAGSLTFLLFQVLSDTVLFFKALQSLHTVFPSGNNNSHVLDQK